MKNDKKIHRVTIRFSSEEMKNIDRKRKKTSLSSSEFLRRLISEQTDKIRDAADVKKFHFFLYQYAQFGNNLNQIAKVLNIKLKYGDPLHFTQRDRETVRSLETMINTWNALVRDLSVKDLFQK